MRVMPAWMAAVSAVWFWSGMVAWMSRNAAVKASAALGASGHTSPVRAGAARRAGEGCAISIYVS